MAAGVYGWPHCCVHAAVESSAVHHVESSALHPNGLHGNNDGAEGQGAPSRGRLSRVTSRAPTPLTNRLVTKNRGSRRAAGPVLATGATPCRSSNLRPTS